MERDLRVEDAFFPKDLSCLVTKSDLSVNVLEFLTLKELRNAALCCRDLSNYVRSDPLLSWRFRLLGHSEVLSLYVKEDSLAGLLGTPPSAPMSELQRHKLRETHSKAHRKIIFNWLVDVQIAYKLSVETLHTTFQLVDRIAQQQTPHQGPPEGAPPLKGPLGLWGRGGGAYMGLLADQLQLVAITSLSIATKFCEVNKRISRVDLIWLCADKYTSD